MVSQLVTSHGTLMKHFLRFVQVLQFVKVDFKHKKCYQTPLTSLFEIEYFKCLMQVSLCEI
jgi:hypothetical protein